MLNQGRSKGEKFNELRANPERRQPERRFFRVTDAKNSKAKVEKLKQILKEEYNINNQAELQRAIAESPGVDIGIFTLPLDKKSD